MTLNWTSDGDSFTGWSGDLRVALVLRPSVANPTGYWLWEITAVFTKHIVQGRGHRATAAEAKRAADRAWRKWLDHAGLQARTSETAEAAE